MYRKPGEDSPVSPAPAYPGKQADQDRRDEVYWFNIPECINEIIPDTPEHPAKEKSGYAY
jgi:hypothetical protein